MYYGPQVREVLAQMERQKEEKNNRDKHQKEYEEKREKTQKWWNTLTLTEKKAKIEAEMKKIEAAVRKNTRENNTRGGGRNGKKFTYQCSDYDKVLGIFIEGTKKDLLSSFGWKAEEEKLKTDLSNSHAELQKLESKLRAVRKTKKIIFAC